VTSFLTILIFWINHHTVFHGITRVDRTALLINGLLLLVVSFISYVTSMLGTALQSGHHDREAAMLYALTLGCASLCFSLLWRHVRRRTADLDAAHLRRLRAMGRRSFAGPVLYGVAAVVALFSAPASLAVDAVIALYFALLPGCSQWR
jgi:uncharacterized membrane protein